MATTVSYIVLLHHPLLLIQPNRFIYIYQNRYGQVCKDYSFLSPRNPLVTSAWTTRLLDSLHTHANRSSNQNKPTQEINPIDHNNSNNTNMPLRENTVFFSRSLLSPWIHSPTTPELIDTMKDLKKVCILSSAYISCSSCIALFHLLL